jgi:hypothetical protein
VPEKPYFTFAAVCENRILRDSSSAAIGALLISAALA